MTNRRRPILMLAEDTSGGVHDTLLAACDEHRYALLGCVGRHDNCTDNLHAALRELDIRISHTPAPLNLFENAWPDRRGVIAIQPPVCGPGGYVTLQAQIELVLVLSACPQDMAPTNGAAMRPQDVHVQLLGA